MGSISCNFWVCGWNPGWEGGRGSNFAGHQRLASQTTAPNPFFTITRQILARWLANFYHQWEYRRWNTKLTPSEACKSLTNFFTKLVLEAKNGHKTGLFPRKNSSKIVSDGFWTAEEPLTQLWSERDKDLLFHRDAVLVAHWNWRSQWISGLFGRHFRRE